MRSLFLAVVLSVFSLPVAAQEAESVLGFIPLDKVDAGAFYDFNSHELLKGVSTPVLTVKDAIEADLGVLFGPNDRRAALLGLSLNVSETVNKLPSGLGVKYKLPGQVIVGAFLSYDFDGKRALFGPKIAYRFD